MPQLEKNISAAFMPVILSDNDGRIKRKRSVKLKTAGSDFLQFFMAKTEFCLSDSSRITDYSILCPWLICSSCSRSIIL